MISNIKIRSKTVELVLQSSPSRRFLCIVSIEIERLRVVFQLTLEKNRGITRLKHSDYILAIHKVKIAYNEQSKKDFAVSFDEIFKEIVVLAEILSTQNS